jgi:hypothetical protein
MANRKLFGTNRLVDDFVAHLTKIETLDGGWATKYLDEQKGQYWLKYVIDEKGLFQNLMFISPAPTTDELIDIALTSGYPDEISAAATHLHLEEQNQGNEFREKLVANIKQIDLLTLDQFEKNRLKVIVRASRLIGGVNRREILNKSYSEILKDAEYVNNLSIEAQKILDKI